MIATILLKKNCSSADLRTSSYVISVSGGAFPSFFLSSFIVNLVGNYHGCFG